MQGSVPISPVRGSGFGGISGLQAVISRDLVNGLLGLIGTPLKGVNEAIRVFFGAGVLGLYDIITRVLNVPLQMIGRSVSQVFYQKITSDLKEEKPIGPYVKKFSLRLFLFMAIPMAVIFFFGEPLFAFVFGDEYATSGRLASWFSVFFLVRFVYYAQSTLYPATRNIGIELWQNVVFLIVQIGTLIAGYYFFKDFEMSFILLAMGGFLCYFFFVLSLIRTANLADK